MEAKIEKNENIMEPNPSIELVSFTFKYKDEKILVSINSFDVTFTTTFICMSIMNNNFTNYILERGNGKHLLNGFSQKDFIQNKTMITHYGTQILISNSHFEEILSAFKSSHIDYT